MKKTSYDEFKRMLLNVEDCMCDFGEITWFSAKYIDESAFTIGIVSEFAESDIMIVLNMNKGDEIYKIHHKKNKNEERFPNTTFYSNFSEFLDGLQDILANHCQIYNLYNNVSF